MGGVGRVEGCDEGEGGAEGPASARLADRRLRLTPPRFQGLPEHGKPAEQGVEVVEAWSFPGATHRETGEGGSS